MSIRIAGQVIASAGSLTAHNEDPNAHADIRELISQGGGGGGPIDVSNKVDKSGDTMEGPLNLPELNVQTDEGTLNLSITAGVATIATNNGLDIVSQTKFDTAPTTDDNTTWENALDTSLVRKAQVATAILNEEMYIRADMNETDSQLQTQINALAEAIQSGVSVPDNVYTEDNLVAGKNVVFEQTEEEINGEVSGSLNITSDFVASGFSDDNVIIANDPINETSNLQSFEICTSFKLYSTTNCGIIDTAGSAGNARWRITLDGGVIRARTMFYASTAGDVDIYGTTYVQPGVKYKLKYAYLADTNNGMYGYRLWVLPEGEEFRPDNTQGVNLYVERPYVSTTHNTIRLGDNSADGNALDGEIYLGDTYINVNGERAWEAVTKGGKTKVSVNDVYTRNNFLAGKDIEIVPEPVEGGIDENTLACWNFDKDTKDEVNGLVFESYTDYAKVSTDYQCLGDGVGNLYHSSGKWTFDVGATADWTIEGFFMLPDTSGCYLGRGDYYGTTERLSQCYLRFDTTKLRIFNYQTELAVYEKNFGTYNWVHLALQSKSGKLQAFCDGAKVMETDAPSEGFSGGKFAVTSKYLARFYADAVRISNIARYAEDFTPPTQPYRKAEPTGNYVVNFTGEVGGSGKNIGEVYYSQSSLASDNAGALPLFTGETIVSANTIYPEFYAWVEKHTELQCTPGEYEEAIAKYGECPKYSIANKATSKTVVKIDFPQLEYPVYTEQPDFKYYDDNGMEVETGGEPYASMVAYKDKELTEPFSDSSFPPKVIWQIQQDGDYLVYSDLHGNDSASSIAKVTTDSNWKNDAIDYNVNSATYEVDGSLRLPKLSNYIKMANTAEGITQKEAGLPNITGTFGGVTRGDSDGAVQVTEGAFVDKGSIGSKTSGAKISGEGFWRKVSFDASISSEVYGNSDTVTPAHTTLYPWVFAYNASVPASTAQAAEFQEGLSGKADADLGNIPTHYDYVIERYDDEKGNWYEVWKSGRLRQGGKIARTTAGVTKTISLLKPFENTNYHVLVTTQPDDSETIVGRIYNVTKTLTETSFVVANNGWTNEYNGIIGFWQAEGKGA